MKLGLIINCVGYDNNCQKLSVELANKILPILEELDVECLMIMPNSDWLNRKITHHNHLPSQDIDKINEIIKSKNNKGFVVRECIKDFKEVEMDCVLHIDGSDKFNLEDINRVVQEMLDPSVDAVLTKRSNISGIDKFRTIIEDFEREIVIKNLPNKTIEDGQSGCWCIRLHNNNLNLTANGYEIELNLLIELLKQQKCIHWLPVNLKNVCVTGFKFPDNIKKMKWLSYELGVLKEEILSLLDNFYNKNKLKIEEAEKQAIELKKPENTFKNYRSEIDKMLD